MPNCQEHPSCDLICSECGSYYCQSDSHDSFYGYWIHHRYPSYADIDTIDEEHDMGLKYLTDPFTKEPY